MTVALKLVTLTLLPLIALAMVLAEDASARGGRGGGGAGFGKPHFSGKPHSSGGHHHHRFRHSHGFHSGARFGVFVGGAAFIPWYYAPAPYYYMYPPHPATYVEQDGYWYYCAASQTYYPYVTQCPGGEWQRVEPTPPPGG